MSTNGTSTWDGTNMSQTELMQKDTVLVLDENDNVTGSASKKDSHIFSKDNPRGILHRAFSVFLFDENDELLLQKRASTKITFPNVWTNTCCSHPLHGMSPNEVDTPSDVQAGTVMGVKHAAIRKLHHELGIPPGQIPPESFKFLTRFHYWAADTVTHGEESPWGEHEIDYVLLAKVKRGDLTIKPHPEEVDEIQWVSKQKLVDEMTRGLWSPWFRIIVKRWMLCDGGWWEDLDKTLSTGTHEDYGTIHRFDPPKEHMGGKGHAGPLFSDNANGSSANGIHKTANDVYNTQNDFLSFAVACFAFALAIAASISCLYNVFYAEDKVTVESFHQAALLCALSIVVSLVYILHTKSQLQTLEMGVPIVPCSIPFLGNIRDFTSNSPWDLMTAWHQKYGPIYSFTLLGRTCVAISSPTHLRTVLQSKIQNVRKDVKLAYKPFLPLLGTGIVTSEGKAWMKQRLAVSSVLRIDVLDRIPAITLKAVRRLYTKLDAAAENHRTVELCEELRHLTLQVISETFFSLDAEESKTFAELYLPIMEEGNKRVWNPLRQYAFVMAQFWQYRKSVSQLNHYMSSLIRNRYIQRQKLSTQDKDEDVLDKVISNYEKEGIWDENVVRQLRDEMKTYVLAGHETSAAMMTWAIYELVRDDDLMKQVYEESTSVFDKDTNYSSQDASLPSREELSKLQLSEACLKESLRKYSVVPTVSRRIVAPTQLGPHLIPKNTTVFISIQGVHHNPEYWPNPMQFDPHRFSSAPLPYTFIPFIEGPRNCLGQYLALLESKMVLALLVLRYEFVLKREYLDGENPKHRYLVPVIPRDGVEVQIKRRS